MHCSWLTEHRTVNEGPKTILDDAFGFYKDRLKRNFDNGFQTLMGVDQFSTRDYIRQIRYVVISLSLMTPIYTQ